MRVESNYGVSLDVSVAGRGPGVVLVSGALDDGAELRPLAELLADEFTTVVYSRRGRGTSGDAADSSVDDEIGDLRAVVAAVVDGPASVVGSSSGGLLALRAAAAGAPISRLVVWEPPFDVTDGATPRHRSYSHALAVALDRGDRGAALELAMRAWGSPPEVIAGARRSPFWAPLLDLAPTLRYDAAVMDDGEALADLFRTVDVPVLVATSTGTSVEMADLADGFFDTAATALVALLPQAERISVPQQGHEMDARAVVSAVRPFLRGRTQREIG
ncbi:hydrolase [Serinibacter arcticus]|uniref:Hydrolase n=1 Tax=Serinibacter arcticus TaxID=1655435 RepID=A0A2U1ZSG1_9MICO|nr:alpha/beta hydrolase [Serinibacter arcticus]PWD49890.1 hydrolase [Serinibacter arcticus]